MPSQTITITVNADDGEQEITTWLVNGSGAINIIFVAAGLPEIGGWSFALSTTIPAGSTVTKAFFRARNDTAQSSGASAMDVQVQNIDPATAAQWSDSNLPGNATPISAHVTAQITWALSYYFGETDPNTVNLTSDLQTLVDNFGGIVSGERVNVFIEESGGGTGFPAFNDTSVGANDASLFLEWTEPSGAVLMGQIWM